MSDHAFFDLKIHTTKSARPLGVKGLGPISAFDQSIVRISSLLHNELAWPLGVKRPLVFVVATDIFHLGG
jgi:hypothetical protein